MIPQGFAVLLSHWWRHKLQFAMLLLGLALATALWSAVQAINGEARASYARQIANMHKVLPELGVTFVKEPGDFRRIKAKGGVAGAPAVVMRADSALSLDFATISSRCSGATRLATAAASSISVG